MCFYPCEFNIPRIAHRLSNYVDMIAGQRNRLRLNTIAKPYVHNGERCRKDVAHANNNKEQE